MVLPPIQPGPSIYNVMPFELRYSSAFHIIWPWKICWKHKIHLPFLRFQLRNYYFCLSLSTQAVIVQFTLGLTSRRLFTHNHPAIWLVYTSNTTIYIYYLSNYPCYSPLIAWKRNVSMLNEFLRNTLQMSILKGHLNLLCTCAQWTSIILLDKPFNVYLPFGNESQA